MIEQNKYLLEQYTEHQIGIENGVIGATMHDAGFFIPAIAEEIDSDRNGVIRLLRKHGRIPLTNPFLYNNPDASTLGLQNEHERALHSRILADTSKIFQAVYSSPHDQIERMFDATQYLFTVHEYLYAKHGIQVPIRDLAAFGESQGFRIEDKLADRRMQRLQAQIRDRENYGTRVEKAYSKRPDIAYAANQAGCSFDVATHLLRSSRDTFVYHPFDIDQKLQASTNNKSMAIRKEAGFVFGTLFLSRGKNEAAVITQKYLLRKYGIHIPEEEIERKMRYYNELHIKRQDYTSLPRSLAIENTWIRYYPEFVSDNQNLLEQLQITLDSYRNFRNGMRITANHLGIPVEVLQAFTEKRAGRMQVRLHNNVTREAESSDSNINSPSLTITEEPALEGTSVQFASDSTTQLGHSSKAESLNQMNILEDDWNEDDYIAFVEANLKPMSREELRGWVVEDIARGILKRSTLPITLYRVKKILADNSDMFKRVFAPNELEQLGELISDIEISEQENNPFALRQKVGEISKLIDNPHPFTVYFNELHRLFYFKILKSSLQQLQPHELDEIVYKAYMKVYSAYGKIDNFPKDDFRKVMFEAITNVSKDLHASRQTKIELATDYFEDASVSLFSTPHSEGFIDPDILALLASLPQDQQTVIQLQFGQGMSSVEIANKLSIPIERVYSLSRFAKDTLRRKLAKIRLMKDREKHSDSPEVNTNDPFV